MIMNKEFNYNSKIKYSTFHKLEIFIFILLIIGKCGGIFSDRSGYITSPGFPNSYNNTMECVYEIQAPIHHTIGINFMQ